ncbi:MAG: hypothetical protein AB7P07_13815 [Hyphomonadaceae bacterium]
MPRFDLVHTKQNGVELIIIPLKKHFGYKSLDEQQQMIRGFQDRAVAAGLKGTVVPVWVSGETFSYIAPPQAETFMKGVTLEWVAANINKSLQWDAAPT